MQNETTKKKTISDAVTKIVASRLGKILFEQFRSIVEDKERWAEMAEELRLKIIKAMPAQLPSKRSKKVTIKKLPPC